MRSSLRIGRIFGIELRVDSSWLFILVLVVWSLSSLFARWHPDWEPLTVLAVALLAALAFFGSVLLHELAHSVVARLYGVPVRDITLHMFGGVSNIEREPGTPLAELLVAVVGPLTSVGLGIAMTVISSILVGLAGLDADGAAEVVAHMGPVATVLFWLGPINIAVGVFNLIPGFPLDGGRILRALVWWVTGNEHRATRIATTMGQLVGLAFLASGAFMALGYTVPFFGRGLGGGVWLALIGLFLRNAATQHQVGAAIHDALVGLRVKDLMRTEGAWVDASLPVRALVADWILRREDGAFPVFAEGRFVGLVCLDDVRRADPSTWDGRVVADVMTPLARLATSSPDEELFDALRRLGASGVRQLPVVAADPRDPKATRLAGVLFERDIARWLELRTGAPRGGTPANANASGMPRPAIDAT
jgi:Zn-dependent protease